MDATAGTNDHPRSDVAVREAARGAAAELPRAAPAVDADSGWRRRVWRLNGGRSSSLVTVVESLARALELQGAAEVVLSLVSGALLLSLGVPVAPLVTAAVAVPFLSGVGRLRLAPRVRDFRDLPAAVIVSTVGAFPLACGFLPGAIAVLVTAVFAWREPRLREACAMRRRGVPRREVVAWLTRPSEPRRAA